MKNKRKLRISIATTAMAIVAPLATLVSCSIGRTDFATNYLHPKTEINIYGTLSQSVKQRRFDVQYTSGNVINDRVASSGRVFPLIRTEITGKDSYTSDEKTGKVVWNNGDPKQGAQENLKRVGAQHIFGQNTPGPNWTEIDIHKPQDLKVKYLTYKFEINNNNNTFWSDKNGNSTKYALSGKDFYYGWVRSLLSSKVTRNEGKVSKQLITAANFKFDDSWTTDVADKNLDNKNNYLNDLFGVDVNKTITSNEHITNKTDFIVNFKNPVNNFLDSLVADKSNYSAAPSAYIDELAKAHPNEKDKPWIKYGISTYGAELKDFLHVAPYYFSKYDPYREYVIKKNTNYIDQKWAKSSNKITKFTYHITQKQDSTAIILQRRQNYEEGKESVLDKAVLENPSQMQNILFKSKEYGVRLKRVAEVGVQQRLMWNSLPARSFLTNYNPKGLKLMYGEEHVSDVETKPDAVKHFFNGDGATLRRAMDIAYNWYTGVQLVTADPNNMASLSLLKPEQQIPILDSNGDHKTIQETFDSTDPRELIYAKPSGVATYKALKNGYVTNKDDVFKASKSPNFDAAKKMIDSLSDDYRGAIIPVQTYYDKTSKPVNAQMNNQWVTMIKVFNAMGKDKNIKFVRIIPNSWSVHVNDIQHHRAQLMYVGWGPDYKRAISSLQGYMATSWSSGIVGQLLYPNDPTNPNKSKNTELLKYIKTKSKVYDANLVDELAQMSLIDLRDYQEGVKTLAEKKKNIFIQLDTLISEGYYEQSGDEPFVTETVDYLQESGLIYYFPIINGRTVPVVDRSLGSYKIIVEKTWLKRTKTRNAIVYLQDYTVEL